MLALLLRIVGILELAAIPAILMPTAWIAATHSWLGLGPLPSGPIVGYLARSLSAFYAAHGAVLLFVSFDLPRYWPVIRLLAITTLIIGVVLLFVDLAHGMPWWWTLGEGPFVIGFALVILWLQRNGPPLEEP